MDGQVIFPSSEEERRGLPSMIFFDGHGDEVGGMLMGHISPQDSGRLLGHSPPKLHIP